MNTRNPKSTLAALAPLLFSLTLPALAAPARCSTANAAGDWAYSYSGTILLPTGPVPVATVGRFTASANGTFSGTQTRSVGGDVGVETVVGTFHEKADCTVTYTANVYQGGVLQRTATLGSVTSNNATLTVSVAPAFIFSAKLFPPSVSWIFRFIEISVTGGSIARNTSPIGAR